MIYFEREIEIYISTVDTGFTTDNTTKLPILAGASIDYSTITNNSYNYKISDSPERLNEKILSGITPPEISFSTYAKPFLDTPNITAVEKLLLNSLLANTGTESASDYETSFTSTNVLPELYIFISFNNLVYKISNVVVKSAIYNIEIDRPVFIEWKLVGLTIESTSSAPGTYTDYTTNINFLKSKLSTVTMEIGAITSQLPIVSGKLRLLNSVQVVKRDTLDVRGVQNLGHYVKNRTVEFNLVSYLKTGTTNNIKDLFDSINTSLDYTNDNSIKITITMGTTDAAHIIVELNKVQIELPTIEIQDVISSNIKITPRTLSTINDDINIKYKL